jgi:hypothetical protein
VPSICRWEGWGQICQPRACLLALGIMTACGGGTAPEVPGSGGSDAGKDASIGPDAPGPGACSIEVSDYDQSCSVDSDCIGLIPGFDDDKLGSGGLPIQSGDYCAATCLCGGAAINRSAVAKYSSDVAKTPLGSGAISAPSCACPSVGTQACCRSNTCVANTCGGPPLDSGTSEGQDGDAPADGGVLCGLYAGVLDASSPDAGPTRTCVPPQTCTPFNGGWACCVLALGGGVDLCSPPLADGG